MPTTPLTAVSGHIPHFDTDLLSQIIEVEVDNAIRQLQTAGRFIDNSIARNWQHSLRDMLTHMMLEEHGNHCMLPEDIEKALRNLLQVLIDTDVDLIKKKPVCREQVTSWRRFQMSVLRFFRKKLPS
ncbi:hypothetical protein K8942_02355 [Candidatus Peribacteria bacterium]|nr:MAG: hypothetical protein K8942_02355 [Candidatus Peribacteria bacterium]